jgi:hypothetical protein
MSSLSVTEPSNSPGPTIQELMRSFEDYAEALSAFQQAHPTSDDGQSPFVVVSDEIALMGHKVGYKRPIIFVSLC